MISSIALLIFLSVFSSVPSCRDFVPVKYNNTTICVSPDYYKEDGIRKPVGLSEALAIAKREKAFLPNAKMVDAIWKQADLKLQPIPLFNLQMMTSVVYYNKHNKLIEEQIGGRKYRLVAGHKKDIILPLVKGRVTIYGWHKTNGKPIQPVSSIHVAEYKDYSHGLRLVRLPK